MGKIGVTPSCTQNKQQTKMDTHTHKQPLQTLISDSQAHLNKNQQQLYNCSSSSSIIQFNNGGMVNTSTHQLIFCILEPACDFCNNVSRWNCKQFEKFNAKFVHSNRVPPLTQQHSNFKTYSGLYVKPSSGPHTAVISRATLFDVWVQLTTLTKRVVSSAREVWQCREMLTYLYNK